MRGQNGPETKNNKKSKTSPTKRQSPKKDGRSIQATPRVKILARRGHAP